MEQIMPEVKGFFLYFDQCEPLDELTDAQCGQLLRACVARFQGQEYSICDPMVKLVFRFFETAYKRDVEKYESKCEQMRANANAKKQAKKDAAENADGSRCDQKQAEASRSTQQPEPEYKPEQEQEKKERGADAPARPRACHPSVDEVAAYCRERNNGINAQQFVDYYAAQGWRLSNGRVMCDWQAAVRTWEQREKHKPAPQQRQFSRPGEFNLDRQRQIANQVLAEMEAEDALRQHA